MARESAYFSVKKAVGLHETTTLERMLDSLPGVTSVNISKQAGGIAVDYDNAGVSRAQIRQKIEALGYPVEEARRDRTF